MIDIEDFYKTFNVFKDLYMATKKLDNLNKSLSDEPNNKISQMEHGYLDTEDTILDFISKVFFETQTSKLDPSIPTGQVEPLDLSNKQNSKKIPSKIISLPQRLWKPKTYDFDAFFSANIKRFTANDVCNARCSMLYKDHYHCYADNGSCSDVMKGKDQLRQHGRRHCIAQELTKLEFRLCGGCNFMDPETHYYCCQDSCPFISTEVSSDMDRLNHVESTHCIIISKRTNSHSNTTTGYHSMKRRRNASIERLCDLKKFTTEQIMCQEMSPLSSASSDSEDAIKRNSFLPVCDRVLAGNGGSDGDVSLLITNNEVDSNFFLNGSCARLFCNLKRGNHYHCPICDRGSSQRDLYVRHLKQRHK